MKGMISFTENIRNSVSDNKGSKVMSGSKLPPLVNPAFEDAAAYQFDRDVVFSDPEYGERWIDEVLKNDSGD